MSAVEADLVPVITALYVPGDRPERFDKAASSGAQMIIFDLEDAVAQERKESARRCVVSWLGGLETGTQRPIIQVRVNADSAPDLQALAAVDSGFEIRLPKVETPEALDQVRRSLGRDCPVTALFESALGLERAFDLLSHPAVTRAALGESDLSSEVGSRSMEVLDHARLRLLFAARAVGLAAPMMSVYPDVSNLEGLRADTDHGRQLGLIGRAAVHPTQLPLIEDVFRPNPLDLDWARQVLAALEHGGVSRLDNGEMVDPAMAGRARTLLVRAAALPDR